LNLGVLAGCPRHAASWNEQGTYALDGAGGRWGLLNAYKAIGNANDNDEVIGEWILPILKIKTAATGAQFAVVEVWEMRKPF